ncbi:MAG: rhodanese-like domain-containing protein [Bacteriovoracia bacterium]
MRIGLPLFLILQFSFSAHAESPQEKRNRGRQIEEMFSGYQKEFPDVPVITEVKAAALLNSMDSVFVDVRSPAEQKVSMIPGAVTQADFERNGKNYKQFKVIAYCTIGYRSGLFAAKLKKRGYDVYNLKGGILAWVNGNHQIRDEAGTTRRVHVYGAKWNLLPDSYEASW